MIQFSANATPSNPDDSKRSAQLQPGPQLDPDASPRAATPPLRLAPDACSDASSAPGLDLAEAERLGDEIAELAARIHAATYRLLQLIRGFDAREGWGFGGGFRSCAHWLSWRTGIGLGTAREKVRVARALGSLPRISSAMEGGAVSFSKVRALTRVATPANEEDLLEFARNSSAAQLERLVRAWRRVDRLEDAENEERRHDARSLSLYPDEDGSWVVRGRLDPEVGALLSKALEIANEQLHGRSDPSDWTAGRSCRDATHPTSAQRRADAIGLIAELALAAANEGEAANNRRADRFQVILHVEGHAIEKDADAGQATWVESGHHVSAETSRRICCDASLVRLKPTRDGGGLQVGRRTRTVPTPIRRALEHRDPFCRFPGCTLRFGDAHHIEHWADGGETRLSNLVRLCRGHHRAVHEGGFSIDARDARLTFIDPVGRPVPDAPPPPDLTQPGAGRAALHGSRGPQRDIGAWTAAPTAGPMASTLDLDWAIQVLRG